MKFSWPEPNEKFLLVEFTSLDNMAPSHQTASHSTPQHPFFLCKAYTDAHPYSVQCTLNVLEFSIRLIPQKHEYTKIKIIGYDKNYDHI